MARISTRKKFLAVGVALMAIFRPTPGFKRRTFVSSWPVSRFGPVVRR